VIRSETTRIYSLDDSVRFIAVSRFAYLLIDKITLNVTYDTDLDLARKLINQVGLELWRRIRNLGR
jgi:small-conductance mechanosensitive channel